MLLLAIGEPRRKCEDPSDRRLIGGISPDQFTIGVRWGQLAGIASSYLSLPLFSALDLLSTSVRFHEHKNVCSLELPRVVGERGPKQPP
jgi:hypothetical protein